MDEPIWFIIMGIAMIVLSKPVTKLHMKLMDVRNRIFVGKDYKKKMKVFYKWYPKVFFYIWIGLGILIIVFHLFMYL